MLSMTPPVPQLRLVLLRHAKSAYPHGVPDHDRPLAGKGRRNAAAAGDWFVTEGPQPDLVICSGAQRARHTWEIVASRLTAPPPVRFEPGLYGATPATVLAVVREHAATAPQVRTLVVVGHEPSLSTTALLLAGEGSDPTALSRLMAKFPTNAVAVLALRQDWACLEPGGAALIGFVVPRV
jgi:phosphohistidine phosphatase